MDLYDLYEGGWIKASYVGDNIFNVKIEDANMAEVAYPVPLKQIKAASIGDRVQFPHIAFTITLTANALKSHSLVINLNLLLCHITIICYFEYGYEYINENFL